MIYGETVQVRWYHHLRGEVKFAGADALIGSIEKMKLPSETILPQRRVVIWQVLSSHTIL